MGWAKDFYHDEICAMAYDEDSFYASIGEGKAYNAFLAEEWEIFISAPYDQRWLEAAKNLMNHGEIYQCRLCCGPSLSGTEHADCMFIESHRDDILAAQAGRVLP